MLREKELMAALKKAKREIKKGHYHIESPADHVKRVTNKF